MDPIGTPTMLLALAIVAHGILWFFKTPAQVSTELAVRVASLETWRYAVEALHGRHDEALENLTEAVDRLTNRFDAWMSRRHADG